MRSNVSGIAPDQFAFPEKSGPYAKQGDFFRLYYQTGRSKQAESDA